jgi:hypothetical protein
VWPVMNSTPKKKHFIFLSIFQNIFVLPVSI